MAGYSSRVIPGFSLTLGYTLFYLSALVLIPLAALVLKTAADSFSRILEVITDPIVVASYRLTFTASFLAALINGVFGLIVAWTLVRYQFPGGRFFDALIDFPFALPTAVAGLTYANLYLKDGWIGGIGPHIVAGVNGLAGCGRAGPAARARRAGLADLSLHRRDARHRAGSDLRRPALRRAHRPAGAQEWDPEFETAARSLGAGRFTIFRRVIFPEMFPAWISGFALAFARAIGEYGSVIFIAVQYSRQIADRAVADRHQARRFPICGGGGHRRRAARHFPAHPARDQRRRALRPPPRTRGLTHQGSPPWPEP